ncbi:TPA: putative phage tail protein [Citrobacter amalonaticus]
MAHPVKDWLSALWQCMPRGRAWSRENNGPLTRFLRGFTRRLNAAETSADSLLPEMRPETTVQLLEEWEDYLALPECSQGTADREKRRAAVVEKYHRKGGLEGWRIEQAANNLGFTIRVVEILPHHCLRDCTYPLWPEYYRWITRIIIDDDDGRAADLICFLEKYRMAGMGYEFIGENV